MNEERRDAIEKAEGFDRDLAEGAVTDFFVQKMGGGVELFESSAVGVLAFERLTGPGGDVYDMDDLLATLKEQVGLDIAGHDNCDWSFSDRHDEEATYVAFAIPSLDPNYAYAGRPAALAPKP